MAKHKWFRKNPDVDSSWYTIGGLIVTASVAISAYHGVKRNNGSILYGLLWGGAGAILPVITPAIAIAQGLGQPGPAPVPTSIVVIQPPPPPPPVTRVA